MRRKLLTLLCVAAILFSVISVPVFAATLQLEPGVGAYDTSDYILAQETESVLTVWGKSQTICDHPGDDFILTFDYKQKEKYEQTYNIGYIDICGNVIGLFNSNDHIRLYSKFDNWTTYLPEEYEYDFTDENEDAAQTYNISIAVKDNRFTFGIKLPEEEEYKGFSREVWTLNDTQNIHLEQKFKQFYANNVKLYKPKPELIGEIAGEQAAGAGSKINISFQYELDAVPETISITDGTDSIICPAALDETKKIVTLTVPEKLKYSMEYTVDLSAVHATYGKYGTSAVFVTNDGRYEKAFDAVNAADDAAKMREALLAVKNLDAEKYDYYAASYFSNEQLSESRKQAFENKLIEYRNKNGLFKNLDFSDLTEAVHKILFDLKIDSYGTTEGVEEDLLGIFGDEFYDAQDKKQAFTPLLENEITAADRADEESFKKFADKCTYIIKIAYAQPEELVSLLDGWADNGMIDISDTDYTQHKSQTAVLMKELQNKYSYTTYKKIDELKKVYNQAKGLAAINALPERGDLTGLLEKYKDVMELDLTDYYAADSQSCNLRLYGKVYGSPAELKKEIANAVTYVNSHKGGNKNPSRPSGGSTNRSGGSSGNGMIMPTSPNPTATPQPQPSETPAQTQFKDLEQVAWARDQINALKDKKVILGVSETEFAPNQTVTRAEFTAMIVRAFGMDKSSEMNFSDVKSDAWYYNAVNAAYTAGLINGDNGKFNPNDQIMRQDMAVIIDRALKDYQLNADKSLNFNDSENISEYAVESIGRLFAAGVVSGDSENNFYPKKPLTRAEAAVVIYNAMNTVKLL